MEYKRAQNPALTKRRERIYRAESYRKSIIIITFRCPFLSKGIGHIFFDKHKEKRKIKVTTQVSES